MKTIEETLEMLEEMLASLGNEQYGEDQWLTGARDTVITLRTEILDPSDTTDTKMVLKTDG